MFGLSSNVDFNICLQADSRSYLGDSPSDRGALQRNSIVSAYIGPRSRRLVWWWRAMMTWSCNTVGWVERRETHQASLRRTSERVVSRAIRLALAMIGCGVVSGHELRPPLRCARQNRTIFRPRCWWVTLRSTHPTSCFVAKHGDVNAR
jgi:hypothetical protein